MLKSTQSMVENSNFDGELVNRKLIELKLAQGALADINEKFQVTFDYSSTGICHLAPNGMALDVNQKLSDLLLYTKEELLTTHFKAIIHPEDLDHVLECGRKMTQGTLSHYVSHGRVISKDGAIHKVFMTVSLLRFPSGRPKYFHILVEEISDPNRYQFELKSLTAQIEERNTETIRFMSLLKEVVSISQKNQDLNFFMAQCLEKICGFADWEVGHLFFLNEEESKKLCSSGIWNESSRSKYQEFRSQTEIMTFYEDRGVPGRVLQKGKPLWIEDLLSNKDFLRGDAARSAGFKSAMFLPVVFQGKILAVMEFFSIKAQKPRDFVIEGLAQISSQLGRSLDESKRKRTVVTSESIYQSIIRNALDPILATDSEGYIISWNRAAEKSFGYSEQEVLGKPITLIIPDKLKGTRSSSAPAEGPEAGLKYVGSTVTLPATRKDGSQFLVEVSFAAFTQETSSFYIGIIREVMTKLYRPKASKE